MRTQQYREVEAIVAKYKKLASETEEVRRVNEEIETETASNKFYVPADFNRLEFAEQLIGHIYKLRAGECANPDVVKEYEGASSCYIKGLLDEAEEQKLVDNFAEFVDYAFEHTSVVYVLGTFNMPTEWSDLVPYLLNNESGKIYIAHSNYGREFAALGDCELTVGEGFEEAAIRALAYGKSIKKYQTQYADGKPWHDIADGQFDVAVVDISRNSGSTSVEEYFNGCWRIVKDGGEILLCMSKKAILSKESAAMRERLTKERMLDAAIQLPSGNILLHIIKRPQKSFVMCDARQLTKKAYKGGVAIDEEALKKEMEIAGMPERDENPTVRRYEYERLDSNILLPWYYLHFNNEDTSIVEIASVGAETVLSDECNKEMKVVTINHLSKMFAKGEFNVEGLPQLRQDRQRRYYRVNGPAVIMAVSEADIAVGYTTETAQFLVPNNLYVLMPKEGVDVRYIAGKLLSKPVKGQIVELVYYNHSNARLATDWTKLVRMDIDLQGQQQFVQEVTMKEFTEQEREAKAQEKSFRKDIRLRKHALIQNISAFASLFRSLEYRMAEQNGAIKSADRLSPVSQMTVGEAMEILHNDLETISYRIEHFTDENDWGKCEAIEPQEFIESYERRHASTAFRFEHLWEQWETNIFSKDVFDEQTGKLLFQKGETMNAAWFPRRALEQVLDNIVANARAHGFKDKNRNDYTIRTFWETDGLNMLIKISNNGAPLPADVDADLVLEYGYTTALNQNGHGGIGGGEIAELMRKFGGNAKVISTPDETYTVTYVLSMPLASLY